MKVILRHFLMKLFLDIIVALVKSHGPILSNVFNIFLKMFLSFYLLQVLNLNTSY